MSPVLHKVKDSGAVFTFAVFFLLCSANLFAQPDNRHGQETEDLSVLSVFAQPGISFLSFGDRDLFQAEIDTVYKDFKAQALTEDESLYVAKQDFQKVNFCFPISAGLQWQWREGNFVSLGAGYTYDNESVVLTDRKDKIHNYEYTLQAFPLFLEYRIAIPKNLISLSEASLFSISARWYWMLPGTEIYSTWGHISADKSILGNGFGVSIGYLVTSWKSIHIYGDIGYTRISVESKSPFSKVVPTGSSTKKAEWDLGGLALQFRFSFGVINKKTAAEEQSGAGVMPAGANGKDSTAVKGAAAAGAKPADGASPVTGRDLPPQAMPAKTPADSL